MKTSANTTINRFSEFDKDRLFSRLGIITNNVGDSPMLSELLEQIPQDEPIKSVHGDGAYDTKDCYRDIVARQAKSIVPPRSNAVIKKHPKHEGDKARNETVRL